MDRAVGEIVAWLDGQTPFAYDAGEALHVLESIAAFHASPRPLGRLDGAAAEGRGP